MTCNVIGFSLFYLVVMTCNVIGFSLFYLLVVLRSSY